MLKHEASHEIVIQQFHAATLSFTCLPHVRLGLTFSAVDMVDMLEALALPATELASLGVITGFALVTKQNFALVPCNIV